MGRVTTALYIFKDGTDIQKEERTKLGGQKASKWEILKVRADVRGEAIRKAT